MKRSLRDPGSSHRIVGVLLLSVTVLATACSTTRGPVRTQGVVTGKHELAPKGNPKVKPRYFLWVKTEDGMVYVEVTKALFDGVKKGDDVCINCDSQNP